MLEHSRSARKHRIMLSASNLSYIMLGEIYIGTSPVLKNRGNSKKNYKKFVGMIFFA